MIKQGLFTILLGLLCTFHLSAQIATDSWRDHLPYNQTVQLAFHENCVYVATTAALFYLDKDDATLNRLSKINGLSDQNIGCIAYSDTHDLLVIGYTNGNIDFLQGNDVKNLPDLYEKDMLADKEIRSITLEGDYAYLACGFGILVLNLAKEEVSDTYVPGPEGNYLGVNKVCFLNDSIFALTEEGLYKVNADHAFLSYFESWERDTRLPDFAEEISGGAVFENKLYLMHAGDSSLYSYDGSWQQALKTEAPILAVSADANYLHLANRYWVYSYDASLLIQKSKEVYGVQHALCDENDRYYLATESGGMLYETSTDTYARVYPNGPNEYESFRLASNGTEIIATWGGYQKTGVNSWQAVQFFTFSDDEQRWSSYNKKVDEQLDNLLDATAIAATGTAGNYYIGTWGYGVIAVEDGDVKTIYNEENTDDVLTTMKTQYCGISGMDMDDNGNLWLVQRNVNKPIFVRAADGTWYNYSYGTAQANQSASGDLMVTSSNHIWTVSPRGAGILAIDPNGTPETDADDVYASLVFKDSDGTTISTELHCLVEDRDGDIWIGSSNGVGVYDDPSGVLDGTTTYARLPQIEVDGYLNPLLEGEKVTSIVVDGANRKWIGTESGGLFLVSSDGTEQILNLNTTNSPLFSNNITGLALNPRNGELFIGTEKGMLSYMTSSSAPRSSFESVYAFPNPVEPAYSGLITIRGLVYNSDVKITDASGRLVYEATSNGGDVVWNGKDLNGSQVHSGLYVVMCTKADGSLGEATKILFIP